MKVGKFISPYLRADDVKAPMTLTIESVEAVAFKNDDEPDRECILVKFREIDQGVVAGKPSLRQLVEILGTDESDEWVGKKVCLFVDPSVKFKGKKMACLRFRAVS